MAQTQFIATLEDFLKDRGLEPRTLGVTDYDMDAPLKAIRRLLLESNGLITIAFKRTFVSNAIIRKGTDLPHLDESRKENIWLTSPYCQIEPAMAFQHGLPILIFREEGVIEEGLLEKGAVGLYMPKFSLSDSSINYLKSLEWQQIIVKWETQVRRVVELKSSPPKLY